MATTPKGNYGIADMYYQYLNRAPTAEELSYWKQQTAGGATAGIDPEEITSFLTRSAQQGEVPAYMANVTARPVIERGEEGMFNFAQVPGYTPAAREGDKTFEGQKYFEADRLNILNQLKAQQAAGMKYTASFTKKEDEILDDLSTRLAAQGISNLTDLKPIMSGETMRDTGEGQMERVESTQVGLYNAKTGEPLNMKMLTNNKGDGTTNYQATFVNGVPVFTAQSAVTGLKQIQQDFGPILAMAASAILPGIPIGGTTLGNFLGSALGLEGAAATAVGNALAAGGGTLAATGSAEKAALAALMVGAGGYLKDTGALGDAMDKIGLGEFRDSLGVVNTAQVSGTGAGGVAGGMAGAEGLVGEAGLGGTGLGATTGGTGQSLASVLQAGQTAGQAGFTGIDLSSNLAGGANAGAAGTVGTGGLGSAVGSATDLATSLTNAGLSAGTAANLAGLTAAGTGATGLLGGATAGTVGAATGALTGAATGAGTGAAATGAGTGAATTGAGTALNTALTTGAGNLLGNLISSIPGLLTTGVNYAAQQKQIDRILGTGDAAAARLTELANKSMLTPAEYSELGRLAQEAKTGSAAAGTAAAEAMSRIAESSALPPAQYEELTRLAEQVKKDTAAAGEASKVPFTPYTMTTGFGTTGVTATGATAKTAAEYEALRQQSLGLAGKTLGAINPEQAAQTLYGQVEALAAPNREREQLALQQRLARQGLLGFGTNVPTAGGGARTVSPMFESLLSAQETARAQQALQATQFGTTEAQRQAALAQGFLGQAQGIDQQTLAQLQQTGALGINLNQLEQANRARALQAQMVGITAPLTTGLTSAQMRQADLARQAQLNQSGIMAQLQSTMAGMNLPLSTGLASAQLRQSDLARQAQLGQAGALAQLQAAIAALGPQGQQYQALGNLTQGMLNPFATALTKSLNDLFGIKP